MALPTPAPITIKDTLVIGNSYTIKGKRAKLIGLYDTFGRFKMEDGHIECFLYWDLERWKYFPDADEENEDE